MAAFYINKLTPRVRYTSQWGCPAIADTSNPQGAPDASAALQALANLGQSGPLTIVVDQPLLANQISLYSGTAIRGLYQGSYLPGGTLPATGLWMKKLPATGSGSGNTCVLRNANWRSNFNSASPTSSSLNVSRVVDQDIAITDLFIDGQARSGVSNGTIQQVNTNGEYVIPIRVHGIYNFHAENVFIYDPCCLHFAVTNIAWSTFRNLRFLTPGYYTGSAIAGGSTQTDGLHFVGPWADIEIDGMVGTTGDDFLALNAIEGNIATDQYPPVNLSGTGPHLWGGWANVYYGNGLRLKARNLFPFQCADVMRIQVGQDSINGNPGNTVDGVEVTGVAGSVVWGALSSNAGNFNPPGGAIRRVMLRDWQLDTYPTPPVTVGYQLFGEWDDLSIVGHHYRNVTGGGFFGHQINLGSGATVGRLRVEDYVIRDDSGESASVTPAVNVTQGSIDELDIGGSGWSRNAATPIAFASISGGSVNRIALSRTSTNNLANQLSITGGTVGQIDTAGICHRNPATSGAAGGAAINLGTGITVANLTSSGSDTAKLLGTSAGLATTKKTDGTERGA